MYSVDCQFGTWEEGRCSATCGTSAYKILTRKIIKEPLFGGKPCKGKTNKTEICDFPPCPSKFQLTVFSEIVTLSLLH